MLKVVKKKKILFIFAFVCMNFFLVLVNINIVNQPKFDDNNETDEIIDNNNNNPISLKSSADGTDASGRVLSTISRNSLNCYINKEQTSLNVQPSIYIPDYYISSASMNFENITPHNYTRLIESNPSNFIFSSDNGPIYVFQKFYVEVNQYVNNVSVFLQDINFGGEITEESFWEVAILNCSNDAEGTPDAELGNLFKAPPINIAAHWEIFNFKDDGDGPIFLNISQTQNITEDGIDKYWFAIRIKVPQSSSENGGGGDDGGYLPKFLYFNQDGIDNIGEGSTFINSPDIWKVNYTNNDVVDGNVLNGTLVHGDIDSFKSWSDEDRVLINSTNNIVNFTARFELNNLTETSLGELLFLIAWLGEDWWERHHHEYLWTIDLYLAINVSDSSAFNPDDAHIYYGEKGGGGAMIGDENEITWRFNGSIIQENEQMLLYRILGPNDKLNFLRNVKPLQNNSITFNFIYEGKEFFNVSVNQFTIEFGELIPFDEILPYDPLIQRLYYFENATLYNGTSIDTGYDTETALKANDNKFYQAKADSHNISIEFEAQILMDVNNSLWEGVDIMEWFLEYPNPIIPYIDVRISSKTNVSDPRDIDLAILEVYKGNYTHPFYLSKEQNEAEWLQVSESNRTYAGNQEMLNITKLDPGIVWLLLQYFNYSDYFNYTARNVIKFRLRYNVTNPAEFGFNVTIDEFTLNINLQNAVTSDIATKIGLGLTTKTLLPTDIQMRNFGTLISDVNNQTGIWSGTVPGGIPTLGIFEFNITSLWHAITFDVYGTYTIYKLGVEIEFKDDFESQYKTGTEHFTVEVTDGLGNPIQNLQITFELLDADDKVVDDDKATTDSDGEATGSLELEDVGEGYKIRATYEELGIYAEQEEESDEFRTVDDFTIFMDNFLVLLPYILIGLAALFTFVAVRHRRMKKLRDIWAEDALILEDLLKISYIMIIHKEAGLTIYNKQISIDLDSDLIGGFITAISQFRSEIKKPKDLFSKSEGFEMDYHDFKIDLMDGDYIRTALILEGSPSETLKDNQQRFTDSFEAKFRSVLEEFTGNVKAFKVTDDLVEKYFNTSLMYPFQLGKHWEFAKLSKLEKALIEVAEQMQKERKYFFISSLLNYGLAGRKESKNQIISHIIDLKRRGLIVPVENI